MIKFCLYKFGQFVVNILPLNLSYVIACFIADILYMTCRRDRNCVKTNLQHVINHSENADKLAKEVFRNFSRYLVEFFRIEKDVNLNFVEQKVKINNLDRLKDLHQNKQGAIVITAHMGNWELGGAVLTLLGFPLVAVALPHKERPVNDLFNRQRQSKGIEVIPKNIAIRRCMETLKENGFVGLVADRSYGAKSEEVNFFNRPCAMPIGPAMFSIKTRSPIIPIFFMREKEGFVLDVCEPIYPPARSFGKESKEDMIKLMQKYITVLERKIRAYPTQWLVFREFWAT